MAQYFSNHTDKDDDIYGVTVCNYKTEISVGRQLTESRNSDNGIWVDNRSVAIGHYPFPGVILFGLEFHDDFVNECCEGTD